MALSGFHPAVAAWFDARFPEPTAPQAEAWPSIQGGRHTLIAAPTGSGKTLAAFLAAINDLVHQGEQGTLDDTTQVLYVSPLKALSNDIQKNLEEPLAGISAELAIRGFPDVRIRTMVRTGDTPAKDRELMMRRPPHILVTTPESLFILLTAARGRNALRTVRTVIVDEIHAMVGSKRGSHLALSLERLAHLTGKPLVRIGLSATQKPIEDVARFLVGNRDEAATIVDTGHVRTLDLAIEVPDSPLEAVMSAEVWTEVHAKLGELIREHRTTLVFVNTRRMAERVARHLSEDLGEDAVTSHHGSLSKEQRFTAERRLKAGELKALVATASLELGIDIGDVDLVCQIGSTRSIATFLQRVGRSGHAVSGLPKGRLFPLSRDELVECAALFDAVRRGELDALVIPECPLDILAQQIVAAVAEGEWREEDLYAMVRRAYPYRELSLKDFDDIVHMLSYGFSTRRGRRSAYLHRDGVNRRLRPRRGARLAAITSGGAIPDTADYQVLLEPSGAMIGTVNEDFAIESMAGDIFQLGNASWQILKVETGVVRVQDAHGMPPTIPFWLGEAPGRTPELSFAVSRLRQELDGLLPGVGANVGPSNGNGNGHSRPANVGPLENDSGTPANVGPSESRAGAPANVGPPTNGAVTPENGAHPGANVGPSPAELRPAREWATGTLGLPPAAANQLVDYLAAAKATLGVIPTQQTPVLERFFDETGGMQLVIHAPFGSRLNRAWGLALRKRFCRKFNFELQAAATEDAIVLSLGPTHSFPLGDVYHYLSATTVRDLLVQALLDAPMFAIRWRWNAGRALAVLRFMGGRKVPPQIQRIQAEDLVSVVFPDQLACFENIAGEREIPDHPLVQETIRDCLTEAMDIDRLESLLDAIESGKLNLVARDVTEPSPLAAEILNAKPYAFLDDAPLEERRTQAVRSRRWLDPATASDLGALDPAAIDRVKSEAWPDPGNADELHDALMLLGALTASEGTPFAKLFEELLAAGRVTVFNTGTGAELWVAAERLAQWQALFPDGVAAPDIAAANVGPYRNGTDTDANVGPSANGVDSATNVGPSGPTRDESLVEVTRSRLEGLGPVTEAALATAIGLRPEQVKVPLAALEAEGFAIRGRFTPGAASTGTNTTDPGDTPDEEWCDRRLLARIHRYTLNRLRQEIEPVSASQFMRFLFRWQRLIPGDRAEGPTGLAAVVDQLEGFEASAAAWEGDILTSRMLDYDPAWLDNLCHSGRMVWARIHPPKIKTRAAGPLRTTPIALLDRRTAELWLNLSEPPDQPTLTGPAQQVLDFLDARGASFFPEIAEGTGLLTAQTEDALGELVAWGLITADGFTGLRSLLVPSNRRSNRDQGHRHRRRAYSIADAGRWSKLQRPASASPAGARPPGTASNRPAPNPTAGRPPEDTEAIARILLRRYGVVFRRMLEREGPLPPWRDLLRAYHRLEARGEIRGGRFVTGFSGEQFALPEAVGKLRDVRRDNTGNERVVVSGADPLNLIGMIVPGPRVPALPGNRILYQNGEAAAVRVAGESHLLTPADTAEAWAIKKALAKRPHPERLRAYLGST